MAIETFVMDYTLEREPAEGCEEYTEHELEVEFEYTNEDGREWIETLSVWSDGEFPLEFKEADEIEKAAFDFIANCEW